MKTRMFKGFSLITALVVASVSIMMILKPVTAHAVAGWTCGCGKQVMVSEFGNYIDKTFHYERVKCKTCGKHSDWVKGYHIDLDGDTYCDLCQYDAKGNKKNATKDGSSGGAGSSGGSGGTSDNGGSSGDGKGGSDDGGGSEKGSEEAAKKTAQIPKGLTLIYNGQKQTGVAAGTGYTISKNKAKNAGTYKATAVLTNGYKWSDGTTKNKTIKWTIKKAKNPVVVKCKKDVAVQYTKLAKTKQTINSKDLFEITKAVGKVNYTMVKANKKIGVNKNTGDIVLKSGLPKGTYTVKVKVTAAGDKNYKSGSKTVTFKVKVQ